MRKETAKLALLVWMRYVVEYSGHALERYDSTFNLWSGVIGGNSRSIFLPESERRVLEDLSNEADGWWYHDDSYTHIGLSFVSLAEWRVIYAKKAGVA